MKVFCTILVVLISGVCCRPAYHMQWEEEEHGINAPSWASQHRADENVYRRDDDSGNELDDDSDDDSDESLDKINPNWRVLEARKIFDHRPAVKKYERELLRGKKTCLQTFKYWRNQKKCNPGKQAYYHLVATYCPRRLTRRMVKYDPCKKNGYKAPLIQVHL